jgi:F-type H+-transporting ATPase subunit epsilon
VSLKDTIAGFEEILEGKLDHVSEQDFYMAGGIDEVKARDYFARKEDVDVVHVRRRMKEVDEALASWDGELADPKRRALIEEGQWLATQLELIGDPPLPVVTEDTRFLAEHARLAQEDVAEALRPDESLTDHDMKQGPE